MFEGNLNNNSFSGCARVSLSVTRGAPNVTSVIRDQPPLSLWLSCKAQPGLQTTQRSHRRRAGVTELLARVLPRPVRCLSTFLPSSCPWSCPTANGINVVLSTSYSETWLPDNSVVSLFGAGLLPPFRWQMLIVTAGEDSKTKGIVDDWHYLEPPTKKRTRLRFFRPSVAGGYYDSCSRPRTLAVD